MANPMMLRALVVLMLSTFAFGVGLLSVRMLRQKIANESGAPAEGPRSLETLPMHVYNTVIQQLKQQQHELLVQSQAEQLRAKTSENFSQAVLSNLSSGVLVFGANGLVKISNPAAKAILGFASASGMSAEDIFRGTVVRHGTSGASNGMRTEPQSLAEEVHSVLHEGSKNRQLEAEYETPAGEKRFLAVTISPITAQGGSLIGAACLISDLTELECMRQQRELQAEISGEMALKLRTSLTTISGYAQQLANNTDTGFAQQLGNDIAHEAEQLDRSLGGFLTGNQTEKAAQAAAGGTN